MSTHTDQRRVAPPLHTRTTDVPPQALGLVLATLEALMGSRSLHQLRPWLEWEAFMTLASHVEAGTFSQSHLGRVRLQMPTSAAIEATARISLGPRWLACVVRLDHHERWGCSELVVLR